jgi:hypothetical protein
LSDVQSITAEAFEILVVRELRKAGIEPVQMRRQSWRASETEYVFELAGKLESYGHRWSALIECSNRPGMVSAADVSALRERADAGRIASALLCTSAAFEPDATARAHELRIALLRVVDAQQALMRAGTIQGGQLPAWLPEFALELVTSVSAGQLLEANQPELVLRELRPSNSS